MISLHYTSHTKAYNTIYTACNIVEAIYSFTHPFPLPVLLFPSFLCLARRGPLNPTTRSWECCKLRSRIGAEPRPPTHFGWH